MSATISANNSKFVIFGAGHDYTLADSGEGEKIFFSHPYVPLNSRVYAGQFYFLAPIYDDEDETVEPVMTDVVKDDIAHCTFTPDINDIFDTEGEVQVKVHYRREYIYPESTVVVEKELTQTIEVVNHGEITVSEFPYKCDIYEDGYAFLHPKNVDFVGGDTMEGYSLPTIKKISCIPWRVVSLGYTTGGLVGFFDRCNSLTDISELKGADISNCTLLYNVFFNCPALEDFSALENWDVSKVQGIINFGGYGAELDDLSFLSKWNSDSLLTVMFEGLQCKTLDGLENWDVSKVIDLHNCFYNCLRLEDISALFKWDVSNVVNMNHMFAGCSKLFDLHGIEAWDVSKVETISHIFNGCTTLTTLVGLGYWRIHPTVIDGAFAGCTNVKNLNGLEGFDVSGCTSFDQVFSNDNRLLNFEGIKDWDVSNGTNFYRMFWRCYWVENLDDIKDWDMSSALSCEQMFQETAGICDVDNIDWDLSSATNLTAMFNSYDMCYSETLEKKVYRVGQYYFYDYEGNQYVNLTVSTYTKDASYAENWSVNGSNKQAFNDKWINTPTWN